MKKVKIIWNGAGGELDSATVLVTKDNRAVARALIAMIESGQFVCPGDSFLITEIEEA